MQNTLNCVIVCVRGRGHIWTVLLDGNARMYWCFGLNITFAYLSMCVELIEVSPQVVCKYSQVDDSV